MTEAQQKQLDTIRAIYEDGSVEIHGRSYKFMKMTHRDRLKVFAFFTKIQHLIHGNDFSFLGTDEWADVFGVVERNVNYNDASLAKQGNHWDKYPQDYLGFVTSALGVISYPFTAGASLG